MSHCNEKSPACGRRDFIVRTMTAAGGAIAGLSIATQAADPATPATPPTATPAANNDLVLEMSAHSALAKVGGSEVIDSRVGKILVMRTGPDTFAATSAICTHRRGPLFYDAESGKIICQTHGALFNADGKVVKGPATVNLKSYVSAPAAVLHLGEKEPPK